MPQTPPDQAESPRKKTLGRTEEERIGRDQENARFRQKIAARLDAE